MYAPLFQLRVVRRARQRRAGTVSGNCSRRSSQRTWNTFGSCPSTPSLYESGVVYEEEPGERDNWQDIPETLGLGNGDCEDLGVLAHRRASLPCGGARDTVHQVARGRKRARSITSPSAARTAAIEDPSRLLGMR